MEWKWIFNMGEMSITRKMLDTLRKGRVDEARRAAEQFVTEAQEQDNFLTRSKILMQEAIDENKKKILTEEEEVDDSHSDSFDITKNTPQFGDVRTSQEEAIRKAINGNVQFEENALKYYPKADDMTLNGKIPSLNLDFQFRYNDPSGDGVYVWTDAMQLTDTNARTIGKIRDAFSNWKDSITQDGDLMEKLKKAAESRD
jgi:transcriptional/translational regulatory protein YebC/TACO1